MAAVDDLKAARDLLAAKILDAATNPKPSYSIDGQSVSWGEYLRMLTDALEKTNELIPQVDPFELRSTVI